MGGDVLKRGYYGIGIFNGKNEANLGLLYRSAINFDADFIFTIGRRYRKHCADTSKAWKHIPLYEYDTYEDFLAHIPYDCKLVAIELDEKAKSLKNYYHPERCIYLLGAEDHGIPQSVLNKCQDIVVVDTHTCMNVAITGGIVMYDRQSKSR